MTAEVKTIIIQAGGKGIRIYPYSANKPKILLPVNGKNILQNFINIFDRYKIIIIGDYKFDILKKYIDLFYKEKQIFLIKTNKEGNSSGLKQALELLGDNEPFIYTWSDLLYEKKPNFVFNNNNLIGLSNTFECRYVYDNKQIIKRQSNLNGIAGFFVFKNKKELFDIEDGVSFVSQYLKNKNLNFEEILLKDTYELGNLKNIEEYNLNKKFSRYFNNITFENDNVIKYAVQSTHQKLINLEYEWYKEAEKNNIKSVPSVSFINNKLILKKIDGKHPFQLSLNESQKKQLIYNCIKTLNTLHNSKTNIEYAENDYKNIFFDKTFERVDSIKQLIPFFEQEEIIINNKNNINPFSDKYKNLLICDIDSIIKEKYSFIHGDCTFSNMLIDSDINCYLIDPRGSFGNTKIYGDKKYDFAKLYYSVVGNYDNINVKKYDLQINNNSIDYKINDSGFSHLEEYFFDISGVSKKQIKLIHSLIWISLCGYVIEDYDAILISFFNGIKLWNDQYGT